MIESKELSKHIESVLKELEKGTEEGRFFIYDKDDKSSIEFEFSVAVSEEAEECPKISFGNMKVRFSAGMIKKIDSDSIMCICD